MILSRCSDHQKLSPTKKAELTHQRKLCEEKNRLNLKKYRHKSSKLMAELIEHNHTKSVQLI